MNMQRLTRVLRRVGPIILLVGAGTGWLCAQRYRHLLNRRLVAAIVANNPAQAIALVNAGADPNTPMIPPPAPSLAQMALDLLRPPHHHRSDGRLTAFLMVCGPAWQEDGQTTAMCCAHPGRLVEAMLKHGAEGRDTAVHCAITWQRPGAVRLLLEHGAPANAKDWRGRPGIRAD